MNKNNTSSRCIAGINSVLNALEKKNKINCLYIDKNKKSKRLESVIELAKSKNVVLHSVDKLKLDLMAVGSKHQGVVAEIDEQPHQSLTLEAILNRDNPLILVLDSIQDPHNLGACLRSAAAANVDAT